MPVIAMTISAYNGWPITSKNAPSPGGSAAPSNTWFLGPARVRIQPFFARLMSLTNRQTDRATDHATQCVAIGRLSLGKMLACGGARVATDKMRDTSAGLKVWDMGLWVSTVSKVRVRVSRASVRVSVSNSN